ncbi:MAG: hypothetical protein ACOC56_01540 [Atribacterota bacterium]
MKNKLYTYKINRVREIILTVFVSLGVLSFCFAGETKSSSSQKSKNSCRIIQDVSLSFYSIYYKRFDNIVFDISLQETLNIHKLPYWFSVYVQQDITKDTKSQGDPLPEIYSDNYVQAGTGIKIEPLKKEYLKFYSILYIGKKLIEVDDKYDAYTDFISGISYYKGWGAHYTPQTNKLLLFHPRIWGDINLDVSYYQRYDKNIIGYFTLRKGTKILKLLDRDFDVFASCTVGMDDLGRFYNNYLDIGLNARIKLFPRQSLYLDFAKIWGCYLDTGNNENNPYSDFYHDFRIKLIGYYRW